MAAPPCRRKVSCDPEQDESSTSAQVQAGPPSWSLPPVPRQPWLHPIFSAIPSNITSGPATVRKSDYFESDDYVLSSAVGHLLELIVPEKYDVKRGKWSFANLPLIPPHFDLAPIERGEARLNLLLRLLKRKDVGALDNA